MLNRENEKFNLDEKLDETLVDIIDFETKEKKDNSPQKKPTSRLMQKLKRKRDEEFGKNK